jgi:DUF1680 family protein
MNSVPSSLRWFRPRVIRLVLTSLLLIKGSPLPLAAAAPKPTLLECQIDPIDFRQVRILDGFWKTLIQTDRDVTIPYALEQLATMERQCCPAELQKTIEGGWYAYAIHRDPELAARLDAEMPKVLLLVRSKIEQAKNPLYRWPQIILYSTFGHFTEMAIAHYLATGSEQVLSVAREYADVICDTFGPDKRHYAPYHQGPELALVRLYQVTGDRKYLRQARYFLEQRGHNHENRPGPIDLPPWKKDPEDLLRLKTQEMDPLSETTEAYGHAVRLGYMYSAVADIARIERDPDFARYAKVVWDNIVQKKLYMHGGIGVVHGLGGEAVSWEYDLPNRDAYAETCASIGLAMWGWRMFLLYGQAEYMDVVELAAYNSIPAGVALDGKSFFYQNRMETDGAPFGAGFTRDGKHITSATRMTWYDCPCCPTNLPRFFQRHLRDYIYAQEREAIYVNLFVNSQVKTRLASGADISLMQETHYPWDGEIRLTLGGSKAQYALKVRLPGWTKNTPVPSDLYKYAEASWAPTEIRVNETTFEFTQDEAGYACLKRVWTPGDVVICHFPMLPRRVISHAKIESNAGKVALMRGPLLYCVESGDHEGNIDDIYLPEKTTLSAEGVPKGLLAIDCIVIKSTGLERNVTAVPYFAWSNRGPGAMTTWISESKKEPDGSVKRQ